MNNPGRWRMGALASAIALMGGLSSFDAAALGLGRITVQSALGEPLRAEIDISEITTEEANTLRAGVASAEAFRAAGLEYTAAIAGLQVSLQKRADGRAFLRLSSSRPVIEPFVDLVLEANWSSGRIVRDYTMLFDPPSLRQAGGTVAPTAPILSRPATPTPVSPPPAAGMASTPSYPTSPPPARVVPAPAPAAQVQRPAPAPRPVAVARPAPGGQQVTVKAGDTAGKIAAQNKPASISLDQMLVALLRSNPDAFIGGNINRLKSGAVLDLPSAENAGAVSPGEASRTIVAQSKDFNDFRRKLADGVPTTQVGSSNRQASGKVQAKVEDRAPATAAPDKLTLSKGAVQGKAVAEDKIAKDRESKAASDRVAELSKNISDLSKLTGGSAAAASAAKDAGVAVARPGVLPASTPVASAPSVAAASAPASAPRPAALAASSTLAAASSTAIPASAASAAAAMSTPASAAVAPASSPAPAASAPAITASQPATTVAAASAPAAAVVKRPAAPPPPPPEPSLMDELQDSPFVLPGLGVLLLLLGGLGFYRYKKRNNAVQVDSSFLESRLQPDSFFGASGGQRIDTNEGGATGSSLVYSPSQLDAAGDVDPVAEADVYLAYGRDLQAEEILKEAMRTNPTRVAIHSKLMEIYAKRRDSKAFEVVAIEAFNLTRGDGPEWAYIAEMGRELDASNPLYQPGGQPHMTAQGDADSHGDAPAFGSSTIPQQIEPLLEEPAAPVDFDLDLDFSLGDEPGPEAAFAPSPAPAPVAAAPSSQPEPTVAMQAVPDPIFDGLEMDFSTGTVALKPEPELKVPVTAVDSSSDMALSASGLSFTVETPSVPLPQVPPAPAPAAAQDSGMLEFDLGSLSLDLGGPNTESPVTESPTLSPAIDAEDDPLATKLALAEEFQALGDLDGARSLAEEVASQSSGALKTRAQAFLNGLS
ncbi:MAG: FimV/HubP family polar landmark protein [Pseudomonadota bacterium]